MHWALILAGDQSPAPSLLELKAQLDHQDTPLLPACTTRK